ncbi:MAG: phosphopantothenoylcysteine decarboxylase, partial [Peptostreptococcaceae bacterium]|nr:phosphopantothenoylcysteine decarboxylase [Peptostreptococcaceae bacterium]
LQVLETLDENQVIIKSAAVADYKPKSYCNKKIKKNDDDLVISLDRNKDIAYEIGKIKNDKILVGFAAETNDLIENAKNKVKKKNLDFIVANDLTKEGAGFGVDTNIVKIIDKDGIISEYPIMKKEEVANVILDKVKSLL